MLGEEAQELQDAPCTMNSRGMPLLSHDCEQERTNGPSHTESPRKNQSVNSCHHRRETIQEEPKPPIKPSPKQEMEVGSKNQAHCNSVDDAATLDHVVLQHIQSIVEVLRKDTSPTRDVLRELVQLHQLVQSRHKDTIELVKETLISSKAIESETIINAILCVMNRHLDDESIQQESCLLLWTILTRVKDIEREIVENDGVDVVLRGMKLNMKDTSAATLVQEQRLIVLNRLLKFVAHQPLQVQNSVINISEAIHTLVDGLQKYRDALDVQTRACEALCYLIAMDLNHKSCAVRKDAEANVRNDLISALTSAMTTHKHIASFQEKACCLLSVLADNASYAIAISKEENAISAVVWAMEKFIVNAPRVSRNACIVLKKLSRHERNKRTIGNNNSNQTISSIIHVMNSTRHCPCMQREACATLCNLARGNSKNKKVIANSFGIASILRAMARHKDQSGVQEWGCAALRRLAANNDGASDTNGDNKAVIVKANGISQVVQAMQQHLHYAQVQEEACGVLKILTINDENIQAVAQAGGIDAILAAMEQHKSVPGVQAMACGILYNMACSSVGLSLLKQAEPWSLLEDAEDEFPCLCGNNVQYILGNCHQL